jgi:predicted transposase YdaD
LLRPEADSPALTGNVERLRPNGTRYLAFEFSVIRLWKLPVTQVVRGGLATLPLALLGDLSGTSPEVVVEQVVERLSSNIPLESIRKLWTSTYLLAGLRYAPEIAGKLLQKVAEQMKESMTHQKILADGREEGIAQGLAQGMAQGVAVGERRLFLKMASRRLGEPDAATRAKVEQASTLTVKQWAEALDQVETSSELIKA